MTSKRFESYLEAQQRQRRLEGHALALGLWLIIVAWLMAYSWHALFTLALFMVAFIVD